jgi:hypothetical protein
LIPAVHAISGVFLFPAETFFVGVHFLCVSKIYTHYDLIQLAEMCEGQAGATPNGDIAAVLRRMGEKYRQQAAALKAGEAEMKRLLGAPLRLHGLRSGRENAEAELLASSPAIIDQ